MFNGSREINSCYASSYRFSRSFCPTSVFFDDLLVNNHSVHAFPTTPAAFSTATNATTYPNPAGLATNLSTFSGSLTTHPWPGDVSSSLPDPRSSTRGDSSNQRIWFRQPFHIVEAKYLSEHDKESPFSEGVSVFSTFGQIVPPLPPNDFQSLGDVSSPTDWSRQFRTVGDFASQDPTFSDVPTILDHNIELGQSDIGFFASEVPIPLPTSASGVTSSPQPLLEGYPVSQPPPLQLTPGTQHLFSQEAIKFLQAPASIVEPSPSNSPLQDPPVPQSPRYQLAPMERHFACNKCEKRFLKRRQLANHKQNEHRRFKCVNCGEEYRHYKSLWQHRRETHEGFALTCDKCNYKTGRAGNLERHKKAKHP